jgi:hypothetical protein
MVTDVLSLAEAQTASAAAEGEERHIWQIRFRVLAGWSRRCESAE